MGYRKSKRRGVSRNREDDSTYSPLPHASNLQPIAGILTNGRRRRKACVIISCT